MDQTLLSFVIFLPYPGLGKLSKPRHLTDIMAQALTLQLTVFKQTIQFNRAIRVGTVVRFSAMVLLLRFTGLSASAEVGNIFYLLSASAEVGNNFYLCLCFSRRAFGAFHVFFYFYLIPTWNSHFSFKWTRCRTVLERFLVAFYLFRSYCQTNSVEKNSGVAAQYLFLCSSSFFRNVSFSFIFFPFFFQFLFHSCKMIK